MIDEKTGKYRKRIPYGMMNFEALREDDCYYVDKTRFIEKIEQARPTSSSFISGHAASARYSDYLPAGMKKEVAERYGRGQYLSQKI